MNRSFWKNRRVLVTGHTGFKGSWLTLWLRHLGAEVTGVALPPTSKPNLFEAASLADEIANHVLDIRNYSGVRDVIAKAEPEVVFHLAAQPLVLRSYERPVETYGTNVLGTVNLLEAVRNALVGPKVVINVTSDKCYDHWDRTRGYREDEALGGRDPYSSSKACSELVTVAYRESFLKEKGVGLASARAGNVVGGGDWAPERLVPDIVKALRAGKPIGVRNPAAIRPWQHVLEPLRGYLALTEKVWSEKAAYSGGWNFGPRDEGSQTVRWVVEKSIEIWGTGSWEELSAGQRNEAPCLRLDCSKAFNGLGWRPLLDIEETLKWTVNWYKNVTEHGDARATTLAQIQNYDHLLEERLLQ